MKLTKDLVEGLFGSAGQAARLAGIDRQKLAYWMRKGFHIKPGGVVVSGLGRSLGRLPVEGRALDVARSRLALYGPDVQTSPAASIGPLSYFLPVAVRGRIVSDVAPAGEWIKWLSE